VIESANRGKARGPVQRGRQRSDGRTGDKAEPKIRTAIRKDDQRTRGGQAGYPLVPKPRSTDSGLWISATSGATFAVLGFGRGRKLTEGELRTGQEDFCGILPVIGGITSGPWKWGRTRPGRGIVVARSGHEVLVANPRQMEGPKRRKRKNDRIDAHKLARSRADGPAIRCSRSSTGVWKCGKDLVAVAGPADALVAVRKDLINTTRGLVKSMGARLPKCSTQSFAKKAEGGASRCGAGGVAAVGAFGGDAE